MPCGTVCHWWTCSLWDSLRKMRKRQFLLPNFLSFSLKHLAWWKPLRRELFPSGMWHDSSLPCSRSYCLCHEPTVKILDASCSKPSQTCRSRASASSCLKLRQCVFSQSFGSFKSIAATVLTAAWSLSKNCSCNRFKYIYWICLQGSTSVSVEHGLTSGGTNLPTPEADKETAETIGHVLDMCDMWLLHLKQRCTRICLIWHSPLQLIASRNGLELFYRFGFLI